MKNKKVFSYNEFVNESLHKVFDYNPMIDYTLLDNNASDQEIEELCEKATRFGVKSVCVMPKHVKLASELLKDSPVLVCTVVDFPGGSNNGDYKNNECRQVLNDGADEVDMVADYQALKEYWDKDYEGHIPFMIEIQVRDLVKICHSHKNKNGEPVILKVIVESGLLDVDQVELMTQICIEEGADFIKTSTGKVSVGAEYEKVATMANIIKAKGSDMKIKASGGVRTLDQIKKYESLGVSRFGMGHGSVDKLNGVDSKNEGY